MTKPDPELGELTEDVFLSGRLVARQPKRGYRSGIDAILLAAAAPLAPDQVAAVLDTGAGVGVVGLAVALRCPAARVILLERDAALAGLARDNVVRNGLSDRVGVIAGDILGPAARLTGLGLGPDSIDHALANPPYFIEGRGIRPSRDQRATSRSMAEDDLEGWLRCCARVVRPGGTVTLIHRAAALPDILDTMKARFGAIAVRPIAASDGKAATRILVQGIKGSAAPLTLEAPLVLHGPGPDYRHEITAMSRELAALRVRSS